MWMCAVGCIAGGGIGVRRVVPDEFGTLVCTGAVVWTSILICIFYSTNRFNAEDAEVHGGKTTISVPLRPQLTSALPFSAALKCGFEFHF